MKSISIKNTSLLVVSIILLLTTLFYPVTYAEPPLNGDDFENGIIFDDSDLIIGDPIGAVEDEEEHINDEDYSLSDNQIVPFAISGGRVAVTRSSSTKIDYIVNATISPKANVSVAVYKYVYSSSQGKYVKVGNPHTKNYTNVVGINKRGTFSVTAGKKYKIRAVIVDPTVSKAYVSTSI